MCKKIFFKISLFILIFFIVSKLIAVEKAIKDSSEINFFSAGIGLMYQFNISHLKGDTYHAFRHFGQFNPLVALASNVMSGNYELSILIGKAQLFNTKNIGFISYSTGLSYVQLVRQGKEISEDHYERIVKHTIGIPFELQITKSFTRFTTYGVSLSANLNKECMLFGIFLNLGFGDFKNYRYKPSKVPKTVESYEIPEVKIKEPEKTLKKPKLSADYSIQFNTTRAIVFLLWSEIAIKTGFSINKIYKEQDLVIPIYYRYSPFETVLESETSLFTIGFQLRKFFSKKKVIISNMDYNL